MSSFSSLWLMAFGLGFYLFGWFVYSKLLAKKLWRLQESFTTPAHALRDDRDFIPTNKYILWGHHFTAVTGAAPIVGPAVAVQWGWLPALLWVVLGTVFFAGVYDTSALWASVRNEGKSIGTVCTQLLGRRIGMLLMVVIFLLVLMVNGVFSLIIAKESVDNPMTVIPAWGSIVLALFAGQLIYRYGVKLWLVTIVSVVALYSLLPIGVVLPVHLPDGMLGMSPNQQWLVILFVYAAFASTLPVWMLLQPRDYINGIQLVVGLCLLYLALLLASPPVVAPAVIPAILDNGDWGKIFPLLFVTIACGAISGFHALVSSGTSSKQVNDYRDIRFIGYLGALGEGTLALATILCCVAGWGLLFGADGLPGPWQDLYKGGQRYFVDAGGEVIHQGLGLSMGISSTLLSLMIVLFAATTMDVCIRLQRYIVQEWGDMLNMPWLRNVKVATAISVATSFALAWGGQGENGDNQVPIWPLMGATNQLFAAMCFSVISLLMLRMNRVKSTLFLLIPMALIMTMSFWGALVKLGDYYNQSNWLLVSMAIAVLVVSVLVVLGSLREMTSLLRQRKAQA